MATLLETSPERYFPCAFFPVPPACWRSSGVRLCLVPWRNVTKRFGRRCRNRTCDPSMSRRRDTTSLSAVVGDAGCAPASSCTPNRRGAISPIPGIEKLWSASVDLHHATPASDAGGSLSTLEADGRAGRDRTGGLFVPNEADYRFPTARRVSWRA